MSKTPRSPDILLRAEINANPARFPLGPNQEWMFPVVDPVPREIDIVEIAIQADLHAKHLAESISVELRQILAQASLMNQG